MSSTPAPADWKLRVIGAALGATASVVMGVALAWTYVGFYIGIIGAPAGAVAGAIFAPRLVRSVDLFSGTVMAAALFASAIGFLAHSAVVVLWVRNSPMTTADSQAVVAILGVSALFLMIATPMALAIALVATWCGRRLVGHVELLWPASLAIVAAVTILTVTGFLRVSGAVG